MAMNWNDGSENYNKIYRLTAEVARLTTERDDWERIADANGRKCRALEEARDANAALATQAQQETTRLTAVIEAAKPIMANLCAEFPTDGWMRVWHGRWKIPDEPLRNDAQRWLADQRLGTVGAARTA